MGPVILHREQLADGGDRQLEEGERFVKGVVVQKNGIIVCL